MNKAKFKEILLIVCAFLLSFAMVYFVYIKPKIVLNNK